VGKVTAKNLYGNFLMLSFGFFFPYECEYKSRGRWAWLKD